MARVAGVRLLLLPVTAASSLCTAGLILSAVGPDGFGVVTLVTTLVLLIPFADLGISAPIVNAYAARESDREELLRVAWVWLLVAAASLSAIALLVQAAIGWGELLGVPVDGWTVAAVLILFAWSVPLGIGQRVLVGTGRVAVMTSLQTVFPLTQLSVTFIGFMISEDLLFFLAPGIAQIATSITTFAVAHREFSLGRQLRMGVRSRNLAARLFSGAWPMLTIGMGLAFAVQSHRVILSHWSTPNQLGEYAIVMTFYAPAWALVASAGTQLWSHFTVYRGSGTGAMTIEFNRCWRDISGAGLVLGLGLALLGPPASSILYGESASSALWASAGTLLLVQASHLPGGMYLTHGRDLAFQARCVILMALVAVPIAIVAAGLAGAAGTLLSTAISIFLIQLIPGQVRARRSMRMIRTVEPERDAGRA